LKQDTEPPFKEILLNRDLNAMDMWKEMMENKDGNARK
jgi:hypothetical protein